MFLFELPTVIVCQLLSDWLETGELCRLDSACCSSRCRPQFLETLRDRAMTSIGYPSTDVEDVQLLWLFRRKVKLLSLSISDPDVNLTVQDCEVFKNVCYLDIFFRNRLRLVGDACRETLKVLVLRGCEIHIEEALQMVSQFSQLHTLEIADLTKFLGRKRTKPLTTAHNSIYRPMMCASTLRTFVCNWPGLSALHVQQIVHACREITRLELTVTGLTDEAIYSIVSCCVGLKTLKLIRCECTTAEGVVAVAALSSLTDLDLNGTVGVTNDSVIPIITNNPGLLSVGLRHAVAVNSLAVMKIAACCPGLTALDVSYCTFVKDDALALIANRCRQLQDLQVCGCEYISDMSMLRLANLCPKLTSINIKDCALITKVTVDAFAFSGVRPYKKKLR